MVMHVSQGIDLGSPNKYGIESMARILRLAEEMGIIIAVENTRRLDYFDFVLKEFTSSHLGYCYDSSHDWLHSKEKTEILRKWDKRLISLHLSDNDGRDDRHWLPGHGIVDWQRIAGDLPDTVGSGCLTLEVYPTEDEKQEKPGAFLDKAYQKISWFQGLLR